MYRDINIVWKKKHSRQKKNNHETNLTPTVSEVLPSEDRRGHALYLYLAFGGCLLFTQRITRIRDHHQRITISSCMCDCSLLQIVQRELLRIFTKYSRISSFNATSSKPKSYCQSSKWPEIDRSLLRSQTSTNWKCVKITRKAFYSDRT